LVSEVARVDAALGEHQLACSTVLYQAGPTLSADSSVLPRVPAPGSVNGNWRLILGRQQLSLAREFHMRRISARGYHSAHRKPMATSFGRGGVRRRGAWSGLTSTPWRPCSPSYHSHHRSSSTRKWRGAHATVRRTSGPDVRPIRVGVDAHYRVGSESSHPVLRGVERRPPGIRTERHGYHVKAGPKRGQPGDAGGNASDRRRCQSRPKMSHISRLKMSRFSRLKMSHSEGTSLRPWSSPPAAAAAAWGP
jgi:hypothetical protein